MYTTEPLNAFELPDKTLCLTYDDGPGNNTLEIADFLQKENIRATFFVVGKYAIHHSETLAALQRMDHIIGNHTYEHPDIPYYVSINGDIQNQILRTDALIKNYINGPIYFRAPYGKWSVESANELNSNLLASLNHIGPIHWDIAGIDCYFWQKNQTVEDALESYITTIHEKRKGIVVMHDDIADMDVVKPRNKTLELTKALIPILKKEGYKFIGLDKINEFKKYQNFKINLQASNKKYVSIDRDRSSLILENNTTDSEFTVLDQGYGRIALQAANGCYLSESDDHKIIAIVNKSIDSKCLFHLIPVFDNRIILRTKSGHFITRENNQLTTSAPYIRLAEIFNFSIIGNNLHKSLSLKMKFKLMRKRIAFIKSKLLSR